MALILLNEPSYDSLSQILTETSEFSSRKVNFTGEAGERARRDILLSCNQNSN